MIGQQIQNYVIISKLGQGGMGTVYKAADNVLGREVALKMLNTLMINQPQVLERFKKEAQVLARLLHPNIAVIYNLIEQEQQHFMVMEYVEGKNLEELMKQHKTLPYQMVVPIFIQALEGLHHAHKKGIFHRDIKPSNLILNPEGTVKLMDFGIAKVAGEQRMTQVNRVIGTVEFLAPEIIEGKEPSVASDIYAAAVTMYELLSGKLPFESTTDYNLMQEILKKKPVALDKLNSSVPRSLSNIVMKALEKRPENRFANAGEFQQALIAAFPELRGVDLGALSRQLETASAAPPTQLVATPGTYMNKASMQATRLETITRPGNVLQTIRQKYLSSARSRIIAGSALLLLLLLLGYSIFSTKDTPGKEVVQNVPAANNPTGDKKNINTGNSNTGGSTVTTPVTQDIPKTIDKLPANVQAPVSDPGKKEKDRREQERKDQEKKDQEKKDQLKAEEAKREQERKEQERREQERKDQEQRDQQKKEITIGPRVEVDLSLRDNLENAPERKDIAVTFTVTSPVIVNGVTVIKQGAVANGTIKLGKVQTDIDINTVTAANGQQIKLKAQRAHGHRNEITSNRSYTAIIQPGTKLNF